jgi:gamma-glutamylcyclotransferase (GGCT)/AIG2-like uncharacterized protein YtfP
MKLRCPKAISHGKVLLVNHSLAFKGVCDAVKTYNKHMECTLWTITDDCEKSLDALEGYPFMYDKKEVSVEYKGRTISAMIYYMTGSPKLDMPSESYLDMVVEGYENHDMNLMQILSALEEVLKPKKEKYAYHFRN